jgi:hypothetical protein
MTTAEESLNLFKALNYKNLTEVEPFGWKCPYCNHFTTITKENCRKQVNEGFSKSKDEKHYFISTFILCPNPSCGQVSILASLNFWKRNEYYESPLGKAYKEWQLIPEPRPRTWPDNVPVAIRQDYSEAVLICELSPKASATLSRRCLQGIIRDVYKVNESSLVKEIDKIKDKIDNDTFEIIKMIRKAGNIGAHMEKDISIIIDIDPGDARILIQLIETLIQKWYIDDPKYKQEIENFKIKVEKANLKK